mgnify:CR=1 FL=1
MVEGIKFLYSPASAHRTPPPHDKTTPEQLAQLFVRASRKLVQENCCMHKLSSQPDTPDGTLTGPIWDAIWDPHGIPAGIPPFFVSGIPTGSRRGKWEK